MNQAHYYNFPEEEDGPVRLQPAIKAASLGLGFFALMFALTLVLDTLEPVSTAQIPVSTAQLAEPVMNHFGPSP